MLQFPLPIITGIGHERDDTVIDSVAHTRVKTPTAAAEFLIDCMNDAADELDLLAARLYDGARNLLMQEHQRLVSCKNRIPSAAYSCISDAELTLLTVRKDIVQAVTSSLFRQHHRLELLQQRLMDASPEKQLARGYSITLKNGKAVKNTSLLNEGDEIITRLYHGEVISVVTINRQKINNPMPTPKKKETYSQAMERLEKIVSQIDNNELEIDALAEKIKEANETFAFCSDKLTKADCEVKKLLSDKQQD